MYCLSWITRAIPKPQEQNFHKLPPVSKAPHYFEIMGYFGLFHASDMEEVLI